MGGNSEVGIFDCLGAISCKDLHQNCIEIQDVKSTTDTLHREGKIPGDALTSCGQVGGMQHQRLVFLEHRQSAHATSAAQVQQDSRALQYASAGLRGDREFMLAAEQQNGNALDYASAELHAEIFYFGFLIKGVHLKFPKVQNVHGCKSYSRKL